MSQKQPDSLDAFRRLAEAWRQFEEVGGDPPDWRRLLAHGRSLAREDLIDFCTTDIQFRLTIGKHMPPLAPDYAATEERPGLDEDGQFEVVKFEYQWCWRHYAGQEAEVDHPIRSVTKADYKLLFPDLASRIELELQARWICRRCWHWTEGDEASEPPHCRQCGFGVDQTQLDLPPQPSAGFAVGACCAVLTPDPTDPPPAEYLGPYRLGHRLGEGGMGIVYAGQHTMTGQVVAVKVATPELSRQPDIRARFLREMQNAARIRKNAHVVPVYFAGEDKGVLYLVMPLMVGESLKQRLKRDGKLTAEDVQKVGREAACGLAAVHGAGLVHRDVTPSNLWLEELPRGGWQVTVMDFGLACSADRADGITYAEKVCGSPPYMAPEQADGQPLNGGADLFGLGCVLYEAATGKRAFSGEDGPAVLSAVRKCQPKPPHLVQPTVPLALSNRIMQMLQKTPDKRPRSAMAVVQYLSQTARRISSRGQTCTIPVHEPPQRSREQRKKTLNGFSPEAMVRCPFCPAQTKVRNLLRHCDLEHGREQVKAEAEGLSPEEMVRCPFC